MFATLRRTASLLDEAVELEEEPLFVRTFLLRLFEAAELEEGPLFVRTFLLRLLEAAELEEEPFVRDTFKDELDAFPVVGCAGVLEKKSVILDHTLITLLLDAIIHPTSDWLDEFSEPKFGEQNNSCII
jgi:hypothetical protein